MSVVQCSKTVVQLLITVMQSSWSVAQSLRLSYKLIHDAFENFQNHQGLPAIKANQAQLAMNCCVQTAHACIITCDLQPEGCRILCVSGAQVPTSQNDPIRV